MPSPADPMPPVHNPAPPPASLPDPEPKRCQNTRFKPISRPRACGRRSPKDQTRTLSVHIPRPHGRVTRIEESVRPLPHSASHTRSSQAGAGPPQDGLRPPWGAATTRSEGAWGPAVQAGAGPPQGGLRPPWGAATTRSEGAWGPAVQAGAGPPQGGLGPSGGLSVQVPRPHVRVMEEAVRPLLPHSASHKRSSQAGAGPPQGGLRPPWGAGSDTKCTTVGAISPARRPAARRRAGPPWGAGSDTKCTTVGASSPARRRAAPRRAGPPWGAGSDTKCTTVGATSFSAYPQPLDQTRKHLHLPLRRGLELGRCARCGLAAQLAK